MASGVLGRHAADRRRDAVSELRRVGDAGELRGARHARRRSTRTRGRAGDFAPFRVPMTWLGAVLAACAVALRRGRGRTSRSCMRDDYVVRPHLGIQADGARRFEYNPRMLDVVRAAFRAERSTIAAACRWRPKTRSVARRRAPGVRNARHLACRRLSRSGRALLSARRPRVPPPRRRADAHQLERVEHLVRRARRGGPAARLRRSRAPTVRTIDAAGRPM